MSFASIGLWMPSRFVAKGLPGPYCQGIYNLFALLATLTDGQIVTMNGQTGTVRLAVQSHA